MSLNDIGRCENCGCNLPEAKPILEVALSVNEIFDIIRAGKWFRQSKIATHEDITLTAQAISAAMRGGRT